MTRARTHRRRGVVLLGAVTLLTGSLALRPAVAQQPPSSPARGPVTPAQVASEKAGRTAVERKLDTSLLAAVGANSGRPVPGASAAPVGRDGRVLVDLHADVTPALRGRLQGLGATVVSALPRYHAVRALVPVAAVTALAGTPGVFSVRSADVAMTADEPSAQPPKQELAQHLSSAVAAASAGATAPVDPRQGTVVSEGDVAMRADVARHTSGADGTGITVGVISSGVPSLAEAQARGELPAVTVLPGQTGDPKYGDEGTAMLEVVHDVAPGAKLLFATAFGGGQAQFAQNIRDLHAAGADIIVDDVIYLAEPVFQDGVVAQAVEDVSAAGTLYVSSAGNDGNLQDGTSGTWEGDFRDSGVAAPGGGQYAEFGPQGSGQYTDPTSMSSGASTLYTLNWSDPAGASANDYDLYVLDNTGAVIGSSTNVQDGHGDPYEQVSIPSTGRPRRVAVVKKDGAAPRFLHLSVSRGRFAKTGAETQPAYATTGATWGHSSAAHAISVAAAPAAAAAYGTGQPAGPYPGSYTAGQLSETFTSDGPRRMFYAADGTPYTPGDLSSTGGTVRAKPDLTAADGVSTSTPNQGYNAAFNPFFGTSAAAPHAAAVAALLRSAQGTADATRAALTSTALDIETPGNDVSTGRGIVMADSAPAALGLPARPLLVAGTPAVTPLGDADTGVEPGEDALVNLPLNNISATAATGVSAVVTTTTPGVTVVGSGLAYPDVPVDGTQSATTPVRVHVASSCGCGTAVDLSVDVTYSGDRHVTTTVPVVLGSPGATVDTPYTGAPVPIPDGAAGPVPVSATVVAPAGLIGSVALSIDGSTCTSTTGATTVGLDHTFVGDLTLHLVSPSGTRVELMSSRGSYTQNLCQLRFDDKAVSPILSLPTPAHRAPVTGPVTGSYRPEAPLSAFDGEQAGGTWTLEAEDGAYLDTGTLRAFTLHITPLACDTSAALPVGGADSYPATSGTPLVVAAGQGVLSNDTDPAGNGLTAVLTGQPAHGSVALGADGGFTYLPTAGTSGPDTFTYVAHDAGGLDSAPVTVTIDVVLPPTATPDSYGTDENQPLVVPAPSGVLANDTDPYGQALTASLAGQAGHGTVTLTSDGSFTYSPATAYYGPDSFTYTASDGTSTSAPATVSLTVRPVHLPQSITFTGPGSPAVVGSRVPLTATASPSGLPVTFRLGSSSTPGACTLTGRTLAYTGPGTCVIKVNQAGNARYLPAPTVTWSVTVAYTAGGFSSPLPRSRLLRSGSTVPVAFVLRTADRKAVPPATAAALAAARAVTVTLTGPGITPTTAVCAWDSVGLQFQCQLKTPAGLRTGTTHPYTLTASEVVPAAGTGSTSVTLTSEVVFFT